MCWPRVFFLQVLRSVRERWLKHERQSNNLLPSVIITEQNIKLWHPPTQDEPPTTVRPLRETQFITFNNTWIRQLSCLYDLHNRSHNSPACQPLRVDYQGLNLSPLQQLRKLDTKHPSYLNLKCIARRNLTMSSRQAPPPGKLSHLSWYLLQFHSCLGWDTIPKGTWAATRDFHPRKLFALKRHLKASTGFTVCADSSCSKPRECRY